MKYELRHYAYCTTIGGASVPRNQLINDLKEMAIHYKGTYSEYNPIGFEDNIAAVVRKNTTSIFPQKEFKLPGFKLKNGLHYYGSDFSNNQAIRFSKQDLLRIANAMDEDDELHVMTDVEINNDFYDSILEITDLS